MIYCINPSCGKRENADEAQKCASCGTALIVQDRITLLGKIVDDTDIEIFEITDRESTFSGVSGSHKILKILKNLDSERVKAFRDEAHILQSLDHKSIPRVDVLRDFLEIDIAVTNQKLYGIIMSKFEGKTLERFVIENGKISQERVIDYLRQLADILNYIQTEQIDDAVGLLHRDIKPSNIIVQPTGELALIDFGFALIMTNSYWRKLNTGELSRVQTMFYTAPEQIDRHPVMQSDYYSLGMTIIFSLVGQQLYTIDIDKKTWNLQWEKYVKIDLPLAQVLRKLTDPNPNKRPNNSEYLLNLVNQSLPKKLRWINLIRSTKFRVVACCITILIVAGIYQILRLAISNNYLREGNLAIDKNRLTDAIKNFELAVQYDPKNISAINNLALVCSKLNKDNCALENYEKAISVKPEWYTYFNLGGYYEDKGKNKLAQQYYKKSIAVSNSQIPDPINNLARLEIIEGDYTTAAKLINQGLKIATTEMAQSTLLKNKGWVQLKQGQYKLAEKSLMQASRLDSTRVDTFCLLAQVSEKLNQPSKQWWEACLRLNSPDASSPEVQEWRSQILNRAFEEK